jgi:hypothetical protein
VAIILGYFILSKNHNKPPKVAQLIGEKLPNLVTLIMSLAACSQKKKKNERKTFLRFFMDIPPD